MITSARDAGASEKTFYILNCNGGKGFLKPNLYLPKENAFLAADTAISTSAWDDPVIVLVSITAIFILTIDDQLINNSNFVHLVTPLHCADGLACDNI